MTQTKHDRPSRFDAANHTRYRPTNDDCLMRKVTTPNFCKVCREGLWHALLRRVALIDDLTASCASDATQRVFNVALVPLAQLRDKPVLYVTATDVSLVGNLMPKKARDDTSGMGLI